MSSSILIYLTRETYDLMKYFNSVLKTPVGFSRAKRDGKLKIFCRFRSVTNGWNYFPDSSNSLCLTAAFPVESILA